MTVSQSMRTIATFETTSLAGPRRQLDIAIGDVTDTSTPVDVLCLSAFPNDYSPLPHGVIGALDARGISVERLARERQPDQDWRDKWFCWASATGNSAIRHIVCFEHAYPLAGSTGAHASPTETVGNIFRAVRELLLSQDSALASPEQLFDTIRVPLLATGDQGADRMDMVEAIVRQAYVHLVGELPVRRVQFVLRPDAPALPELLVRIGAIGERVRNEVALLKRGKDGAPTSYDFDYFISYRHREEQHMRSVVERMKSLNPGLRLFIDKEQLSAGRFWKADLLQGLASSARALCFITDTYPDSPECMDEFHASVCLTRARGKDGFLVPIIRLEEREFTRLPRSIRVVHCHTPDLDISPETLAGAALRA
jgi:hypothetical protein